MSIPKGWLDFLREQHPVGSRIKLREMGADDPCPIKPGSMGTLQCIDDQGTFHVAWDDGRGLGLIIGQDSFTVSPPPLQTLKLYMPMTATYYDEEDDPEQDITMDPREAAEYAPQIINALQSEGRWPENESPETAERGLMAYFDGPDSVEQKVTKMTDALGNSTTYTYDELDRLLTATDAKGGVTTYTYTDRGNVATVTDAEGYVTSYEYDGNQNLVKMTTPDGITTYEYDPLDRLIKTTTPDGKSELITYNGEGDVTSKTDKAGHKTSYVLDANGQIVETIDALGNSTLFEYDAMGRLTKTSLHRVDAQDKVDEWEITIYEYDGRGLVTKETNALGAVTAYTYDGNGNLVSKKDAEGYETEYTYNALDFVTQINYNGGKQASYRYNKVGTLVEMEDWTGTTSFEVDLLQRITQVTDHKGNVVEYGYDEVGNQTSIAYPDDTGVDYTYDLLGQLKTVTEDDSRTTAYTYDGMGRMVKMEYPHGWVEDYVYDSIGQLLRVDDTDPTQKDMKQQKHVYKYDDCGNMIYEYMRGNGTGEATTENTYNYDALHRITRTDEVYGKAWREYQYDSLGNLTYENNSNSVHYDYKLNNLNQITEKTYGSNDKERTIYTYDKRGNLVLEEYGKNNGSGNGNGQRTTVGQYTYDETNKMVLGVNSSGESSAYLYNGLGALVEDTWKIAKNGYGYHSVDAGLDDTDTGSGRGGGGSNGNGNGNGNGQGNGNGSGDKPTGSLVTSFSTVVKQFVVDYTSPTFEPLMEHEVNGLDYRYVYGSDRLSVNITGVETSSGNLIENGNQIRLYYHMDYLGTTDYLTSPVSLKVTSWTHYNEWGEITHNAVLKSGQRELDLVKRYATHDYDAVLGMYYAKARFYDAENRRFASMDPVKGELTDPLTMVQYIYVVDCPLIYVDLGGEQKSPPSSVDGGANKNTTTPKPTVTKPSTPKASDATKGATSGLKGPTSGGNGATSGINGAVSGAGMSQTSDRGTK
jgi:RHS repeat-associated protein